MAKLVTKFRYYKPGGRKKIGGYAKYIALRDGVERCDDSKKYAPVSYNQKQLIAKILRDYPDSAEMLEYDDYKQHPTVGNASEFISRAIEDNTHSAMRQKTYADYIATRPRAEKVGSHGLFSDEDDEIVLSEVAADLNTHEGNVWTMIVSLRREDAERLGYNNARAWQMLLRSHTQELADALRIPLEDLKWYGAFHNESHHPHIHVIAYVALCSTADRAALRMLKDYPQLKQVYLCLDHDSAGIEGAYRIADSIHSLGEYQVYRLFPAHKDWDEDLKARMGKDAIPAGEHPKLAYIAEKTAELKEMCLEDTDEYIKYKRMPADLFDDTMRKLERLKKQIIASDLTEKKESCAAEMAKTAVAFCVLRSRQIGKPVTAEALADQMAKLYKPHRDKQNISSQLDSIGYDLKEIREDADKSDAQTKTEIEWQIKRMLLLGLSCLQLGGSISLSPTVAEPTVGQAISY